MRRFIVMAVLALSLTLGLVTGATALADGPTLLRFEQYSFGQVQPGNDRFNDLRGVAASSDGVYVADTMNNRLLKMDINGQPVWSLGSFGDGQAQFVRPNCIAVEKDRVLVNDKGNARVQEFSFDGRFLGINTTYHFNSQCNVAVDNQGNVWRIDADQSKLLKTAKDGRVLMSIGGRGQAPGQTSQPRGLALIDGRLLVADSGNNRVQTFVNGQFVGMFGNSSQLTTPYAIAVSENNVAVIDFWDSRLQLYDRQFNLLRTIGADYLYIPLSVTFAPNGQEIYVGDSHHHVLVFSLEGQLIRTLGSYSEDPQVPGLFHPYGMVWGPDGMLVIANKFNQTVVSMNPQTGQIQRVIVANIVASGLALDNGILYVAGGRTLTALEYASGSVISAWDVHGYNPDLHSIVVQNGRLIASDTNGNRLIVFGAQPLTDWHSAYYMNKWLQGNGVIVDSKSAASGLQVVSSRHETDMALKPGAYSVSCPVRRASGGCRVWINGMLIVDSWSNPPVGQTSFTYLVDNANPGKMARVRVERWSSGVTQFEFNITPTGK